MDLSSFFADCHVFPAAQSTKEHLPENQSAVYAFYEYLSFDADKLADEIDRFKTKHGRSVSLTDEEWPFRLSLSFRGNPIRFKGGGKKLVDDLDATSAKQVAQHLKFLSFLNEPLYIGKTEDVKTRFIAHHEKGFLFKMKDKFLRSPDEFLFFAYFCPEELVRTIESILIQVVNPPFCEQKS